MIYDVSSALYSLFVYSSSSGAKRSGVDAKGPKDLKAKGSDGKYQGE